MVNSAPFRKLSKEKKRRLLGAARELVITKKCSLRSAARQFNIPWSTFRVFFKHPVNTMRPTGHPPTLTKSEETLIADSAIQFARDGTPLSRDGLKHLVQHFCERLPKARQAALPFKTLQPADKFLSAFFKRNCALSLKRRCNLESDRAIAMSSTNIAEHYARLQQAYNEIGICSGPQSIFSPFKTKLRDALNERILAPSGSVRNDIYTLCELIHNAYKESVTYSNINNGFKACAVWCAVRRRAISEVIKIPDISNTERYGSRQDAFESFLSLCESYRATRNLLRSDGPIL